LPGLTVSDGIGSKSPYAASAERAHARAEKAEK
jgi:hypothetical protein